MVFIKRIIFFSSWRHNYQPNPWLLINGINLRDITFHVKQFDTHVKIRKSNSSKTVWTSLLVRASAGVSDQWQWSTTLTVSRSNIEKHNIFYQLVVNDPQVQHNSHFFRDNITDCSTFIGSCEHVIRDPNGVRPKWPYHFAPQVTRCVVEKPSWWRIQMNKLVRDMFYPRAHRHLNFWVQMIKFFDHFFGITASSILQ